MERRDVSDVPQEATARGETESVDLRLQLASQASIAGDQELGSRQLRRNDAERVDEPREILLWFKSTYGADDDIRGRDAESPTRRRLVVTLSGEEDRVDRVQDDGDVVRRGPRPDQLLFDIGGYRHHVRESRKYIPIAGVVDVLLASAVTRPPVRGRERNHTSTSAKHPRQQIRLVIVGMDD